MTVLGLETHFNTIWYHEVKGCRHPMNGWIPGIKSMCEWAY